MFRDALQNPRVKWPLIKDTAGTIESAVYVLGGCP